MIQKKLYWKETAVESLIIVPCHQATSDVWSIDCYVNNPWLN